MASVNSVSGSSSASSLYGNKNVLSGLASGLDTEAMIENSISGYQTKLTQLEQEQTKIQWKQESFREIIDKAVNLNNKYSSYTSSTNLMGGAFFTGASATTTNGTHADMIAASGTSTSNISIKSATLATSARYMVTANTSSVLSGSIKTTTGAVNLSQTVTLNNYNGTMTLSYGSGKSFSFTLDEREAFSSNNAAGLADVIRNKLKDIKIYDDDNNLVSASDYINVNAGSSSIEFKTKKGGAVSITEVSGGLSSKSINTAEGNTGSFTVSSLTDSSKKLFNYIDGKSMTVSYNGQSKKITLDALSSSATVSDLARQIQTKITAENGGLKFAASDNNSLEVNTDINDLLGMGRSGVSSFASTNTTLGELLGNAWSSLDKSITINGTTLSTAFTKDSTIQDVLNAINNGNTGVTVSYSRLTSQFVFATKDTGSVQEIHLDGLAKTLFGSPNPSLQDVTVADALGVSIGSSGKQFTFAKGTSYEFSFQVYSNTTVDEMMNALSENYRSKGIFFSYDEATNSYEENVRTSLLGNVEEDKVLEFYIDGIPKNSSNDPWNVISTMSMPRTGDYQAGTDAEVEMTVNGSPLIIKRSSNTIDMDGMSVTLKGAFETKDGEEAVTFGSTVNADKVVDAVKSFVDEYNTLVKSIREAFTTQPAKKSDGSAYQPLTENDQSTMSEAAVKNYEKTAKQGLLFGDSDLSSMYTSLVRAVTTGLDRSAMNSIGLGTTFSNGVTTLTLDENKLRSSLDSGTDTVKKVFADSMYGANDGIAGRVKKVLDTYSSTSMAHYGILVKKAGTPLSTVSLNSNSLQKQSDNIQTQIDSWTTKMNKKVDYYTRQFTLLEKLMNTMNGQSSMMAGLMGG